MLTDIIIVSGLIKTHLAKYTKTWVGYVPSNLSLKRSTYRFFLELFNSICLHSAKDACSGVPMWTMCVKSCDNKYNQSHFKDGVWCEWPCDAVEKASTVNGSLILDYFATDTVPKGYSNIWILQNSFTYLGMHRYRSDVRPIPTQIARSDIGDLFNSMIIYIIYSF